MSKKEPRRIPALLLCLVMVITMLPTTVFSEGAVAYPGWDTDSFVTEDVMTTDKVAAVSWAYTNYLPGCSQDTENVPYFAEFYVWAGTGVTSTRPDGCWIMTIDKCCTPAAAGHSPCNRFSCA